MSPDPDVASLAALLVEPARAAMLMHLLDGRSWTASELARVAGVKAPAASVHLRRLVDGQVIRVSPSGRHRYFRIAGAEVAQLLERFAAFAPPGRAMTPGARRAAAHLRECRLCYDHLAGRVGVALAQSMVQRGWLAADEPWFRLTAAGQAALAPWGLAGGDGRTCVDWSERRLHLAGALGRQLTSALLARDWLRREPGSRALWLTAAGRAGLQAQFGVTEAPV